MCDPLFEPLTTSEEDIIALNEETGWVAANACSLLFSLMVKMEWNKINVFGLSILQYISTHGRFISRLWLFGCIAFCWRPQNCTSWIKLELILSLIKTDCKTNFISDRGLNNLFVQNYTFYDNILNNSHLLTILTV